MPYVRDDVQNVLNLLNSQPGPQMHEVDATTARQMMLAMGQMMEKPADPAVTFEDVDVATTDKPLRVRVYTPANGTDDRVLVFFHGGGFVIGDLQTHHPLCAEIAKLLQVRVVSVDYRLAPEAPFPAAAEDCIAATRWAALSPRELGHVHEIIVAGDSAGGNLAAIVARELTAEKGQVPIVAQWLIYPATDMGADSGSMKEFAEGYLLTEQGMIWFMNHYAAQAGHKWASPLHAEEWDGLPPAVVFTCGLDPLRDQGRAYAARLIETGHRVIYREAPGQIHGCMNLRGAIPSAQADLEAQIADLKALLA